MKQFKARQLLLKKGITAEVVRKPEFLQLGRQRISAGLSQMHL